MGGALQRTWCTISALVRIIIIIVTDVFSQCPPDLPNSDNYPRNLAALSMMAKKSGQGPGSVVVANTQVILTLGHIWEIPPGDHLSRVFRE